MGVGGFSYQLSGQRDKILHSRQNMCNDHACWQCNDLKMIRPVVLSITCIFSVQSCTASQVNFATYFGLFSKPSSGPNLRPLVNTYHCGRNENITCQSSSASALQQTQHGLSAVQDMYLRKDQNTRQDNKLSCLRFYNLIKHSWIHDFTNGSWRGPTVF